ncbi:MULTISPECIES: hypothetical protein [unclassified Streptomyces]|uniref:hypothetical protein n=1 Tax=unclassified Streptomyces TaxID=2593676 RepID=UPI002E2FAF97|nr:hypothetical protein [Streptomyces sp. NBC_01268]
MRPLLWLLLAVGVVANVFVTSFSGYTGATEIAASVGTGTVALGAGVGLWLTRSRAEERA